MSKCQCHKSIVDITNGVVDLCIADIRESFCIDGVKDGTLRLNTKGAVIKRLEQLKKDPSDIKDK